ncbi:MAG: cobalamin-dependent protein [Kiritimatiellae bacterium]|nr:cobalamin-dependent protein [Kiritimatiellia bacterium]
MAFDKPDIVFVNPGSPERVFQALGGRLAAVEPPIWGGMLARSAREQGFRVALIDANAERLNPADLAQRVAELAPSLATVVAYGPHPSASTQTMPAAGAACRAIKRMAPAVPVLLVGGHVSALPERTLREEACDFVCRGEGPLTIRALLRALRAGGRPALDSVPGLWRVEGGSVRAGPPAPLIADLDADLPGVAWDLLPMPLYRAHNWHCFGEPSRQPYAALYTSLGCPFDCAFCCTNAPFGGPNHRRHSPRNAVEEIDRLVCRYGVRHIKIADEMFILKRRHVEAICDLLIQRGYDLNLWAYARVDTAGNPRLLDKLRRAGFRWLALGIEAASERVQADMSKPIRKELCREVVRKIRAAGIYIIGNFIFGLPEDDLASMRETLDFAKELQCEFVNFYCAMPHPGSRLYDIAEARGWPMPDSWAGFSQYAYETRPLPTNHLSGTDVLRFRDEAFVEYCSDPAYQRRLASTFGDAALAEIRSMLAHNLERKHVPRE